MIRKQILPALIALHTDAIPFKELSTLQAISNNALEGEELPKRIKLFNWGVNDTVSQGKFIIGPGTVKALAANQERYGYDRIALDYNHNSVPSHPNYQPDPRKTAAFGVPVVVDGDGLYVDSLSYTPSGKANAGEYSDLSPTVARDPKTNEVIFIHSVALCHHGEVKGLTFLSADVLGTKPQTITTHKTETTTTMDFKKLICAILGLDADTATDDDIQAAAEKFDKGDDTEKTGTPASETLSIVIKKELKPFIDQLDALTVSVDKERRANLLALAVSQGKEVPKSAEALPLEQLSTMISELPVTVPTERRTPSEITSLAIQGDGITAAQAEVNKQLGISPEQFKKHNS